MSINARNRFGEILLRILSSDKRSVKWLAEESGVSYQTIHTWIRQRETPRPRPDLYAKIIKTLRITPSDLPIDESVSDEKSEQLELKLLDNIEANTSKLRGLLLMGCSICGGKRKQA